jgi:hypothetical protein
LSTTSEDRSLSEPCGQITSGDEETLKRTPGVESPQQMKAKISMMVRIMKVSYVRKAITGRHL